MLTPTAFDLEPENGQLCLTWSDGSRTRHSMATLRRLCPCATCRTEREKMEGQKGLASLRVIQPKAPVPEAASILEVVPVGRYALTFRWNDGHQTGIYSYDFLRKHAEE
jgi:DUF971 family protein